MFKSILRGFRKQKLITFINMMGLSIGLTLVMFIAFYLVNESQADKFHKNAQNIYRVETINLESESMPFTSDSMAIWLKDNFAEVELSTRIRYRPIMNYVTVNNRNFEVKCPILVDSTFFRMFSFPVAYGNIAEGFNNNYSVVLTAPLARKLFGDENPVGKTMSYCGKKRFTVTAVLQEMPANSSMQFDLILPSSCSAEFPCTPPSTFIVTRSNARTLTEQINKAMKKQFPETRETSSLMPLTDIHFSPALVFDNLFKHGNKTELYVFMLIAIVVLFIAVINFINLTVALSTLRFKDNGIRKIEGAGQVQLLARFIAESVLISLAAAVVAAILIELFFPLFNHLLSNPLERSQLRQPWFYAGLAGLGLLTGLLAGAYPAFKFSHVPVTSVLLSSPVSGMGSGRWSNGLLVFQFATSVILIVSSLFLNKQMDFMQTCRLGFDKDQVIYMPLPEELKSKKNLIIGQLKNISGIDHVVVCDAVPGLPFGERGMDLNINGENKFFVFNCTMASEEYIQTLGLRLVQGRDFDPSRPTDKNCYIVNESFVKKSGLTNLLNNDREKIIGVVKDFNFGSLHQPVAPLAIVNGDEHDSFLMIRIKASTLKGVSGLIGTIKKNILDIAPGAFVDVQFVDDLIHKQYIKEEKVSKLIGYFSFFAIFISCLGLFALATLTINKRVKEIGIRKVYGARISEVMGMLNKDFVKWVVIAYVIAVPTAYYAMNKWLESFAYKTELSWWIFALAGLLALGIALLTVSWQSWKAATRNPVEVLRSE
jgi:putative ABC transport system permease protein